MQRDPAIGSSPRHVRPLFLALGVACVSLGYVGYIVPGMPGTVFFIVALWAFKRSSPRFETWLLNHPWFGPTLRDWDADRSMRVKTKLLAIGMLWASILISSALLWGSWAVPVLWLVAMLVSLYIWTRKTKRQ